MLQPFEAKQADGPFTKRITARETLRLIRNRGEGYDRSVIFSVITDGAELQYEAASDLFDASTERIRP